MAAIALAAFLAFPHLAGSRAAAAEPPAPQLVPVLEPGKPMRFQAVEPPPPVQPAGLDSCELNLPRDRRSTPSKDCMKCHDGSRGANAGTGHRFDIEYVSHGKELRPDPEKFNPMVILAGGMVTCMSCHDPASTAVFHLAAPTSGPVDKRLCAACHIR